MNFIPFEDFKKLEIRVGRIESAENIEGSEKLLKLCVDFGEFGKRQILAGLAKHYLTTELIGIKAFFAFNLEPRNLMGLESQGMILAVDGKDWKPILLKPAEDVEPGSMVK
jgi:methionine--tRNA ligase beta chain